MTKTEYTIKWLHKWAEIAVVEVDVVGEAWTHARPRVSAGSMVIGGPPDLTTVTPTLRMSILFGPDGGAVMTCDARGWQPDQREKVIAEHTAEASRRYTAFRTGEVSP